MRDNYKYAKVDLAGKRHGRLVALRKADHGRSWWVCKCDCGTEKEMMAWQFFSYQSCGCLEKENRLKLADFKRTHGKTETKLYSIYCGMKQRCYNPHYKYYNRYGGRGISICDEWLQSFDAFETWAYQNGYNPSLDGHKQSIDRIKIDGDYSPDNCRWANQTEQVRNRSNTRWVPYDGKLINPYEFAEMFGITNRVYIYRHLDKGETGEEIVEKWKKRHPQDSRTYQTVP